MRRILAAAVLGGALFAAAACGGNDNGGNGDGGNGDGDGGNLSNEEACAQGEAVATEFATESSEAGAALVEAAETGDEAQVAEAANEYTVVTGDMADRLRDIAADAEDPELKEALEDFATELETLAGALASDPTSLDTLDTTGLNAASDRLEVLCPTS